MPEYRIYSDLTDEQRAQVAARFVVAFGGPTEYVYELGTDHGVLCRRPGNTICPHCGHPTYIPHYTQRYTCSQCHYQNPNPGYKPVRRSKP